MPPPAPPPRKTPAKSPPAAKVFLPTPPPSPRASSTPGTPPVPEAIANRMAKAVEENKERDRSRSAFAKPGFRQNQKLNPNKGK
eukprot:2013380-Karenia_brevis.AAC.1